MANQPASGANASGPPFSTTVNTVTVTIDGMIVQPLYAGLAPTEPLGTDSVGLYEVDIRVPSTAPLGDNVPVAVSVNGITSAPLKVSIQQENAEQSISSWVQFGPNGAILRTITSSASCPSAMVDGSRVEMSMRAPAAPPLWPVLSCEMNIPATAKQLSTNGVTMPLPKADVRKVTVIGDTGCRMDSSKIQACNDPVQWPVNTVAQSAAATSPDILIHMGDYHYREAACPSGNAGCAGSPWGYNWQVWYADVFKSIAPAFTAAPFVMIRGNHEMCSRAGEGWFRFLDPRPYTGSCQMYTDPYLVPAGPTQFFVMDSAEATDTTADPALVSQFKPYSAQLGGVAAGKDTWVMMHHPMWGFDSTGTRNLLLQTASGNNLPDKVSLALAGHIHTFQTLTFAPARTPQMVAGNSGDFLQAYAANTTGFDGMTVGNAMVTASSLYTDFGFTTWTWDGATWSAVARTTKGVPIFNCSLGVKALSCKAAQ